MCDSIANGGPVSFTSTGGGGGSCPPANVIIASNVLDTNGNVIAGNVISQDGTFTGNLYVAGHVYGNIIYSSVNISGTANVSVLQAGSITAGTADLGNLYVANSVTTTNVFFQNAILPTNLPILNAAQGTWGSSANVSQVTVDQYGRVSTAANVAITSSQWSTIDGNVAYQNGVSIGSLSNPPNGSNLYVLGTATFTNIVGNGSSISSLNSSNLVGNVANATVALVVSQAAQPNITSVGVLTGLTVNGLLTASNGSGISNLNASNLAFGVVNSALILGNTLSNIQVSNISGLVTGNALSNLNASNLAFGVVNSALILGNTLSNIQVSNISGLVTGNALSNLNASNLAFGVVDSTLIFGNTLSNISGSNVTGNVANSDVALVVSQGGQPNITSVGTLTYLTIDGLLIGSNASGLANISGSNVTGNVANADVALVVSQGDQPNITSVGTLTNLVVSNSLTTSNVSVTGNIEVQGTANIWVANIANIYTTNIVGFIGSQWTTGTGNIYYTGDVGIGTSIVSANLTVQGNIYASNAITTTDVVAYQPSVPDLLPYNQDWIAVAVNSTGRFVTIANISDVAAYSNDGISWLATSLTTSAFWRSIAVNSSGRFVAISASSLYVYSDDGINWTSSSLPFGYSWRSITVNSSGRFVVVGWQTATSLYSDDGINWYSSTLPSNQYWTSIIVNASGRFVAVGSGTFPNPSDVAAYSDNGVNWGQSTMPFEGSWTSVAVNSSGRFVALASGTGGAYSDDGVNWTPTTLPTSGTWYSIAVNSSGRFVTLGDSTLGIYSDDGDNWATVTLPTSGTWYSIAVNSGGRFVAALSNSDVAAYSDDGIHWYLATQPSGTVTTVDVFTENANVGTLNVWQISNLNSLALTNNIYVSNFVNTSNANLTGSLNVQGVSNLWNANVANVYALRYFGDGGLLSNITSFIQPVSNLVVSNAVTTTNIFANTLTLANASASITGNLYVSNALTTTNVFANTLTLSNASARITGNLYVSNALTTTNLFANTLTLANASASITGNLSISNALTTTNIFANTLTLANASARITGNLYVSNALTTTNIFANTLTLANASASITGNLYVSNALSSTNAYLSGALNVQGVSNLWIANVGNVYALRYFGDGGLLSNITNFVQPVANLVVSNAVTTTNLVANTLTLANASASITGNLYVSNAVSTTNAYLTGALNVQGVSNVTNIYALRYFGDGGLLSNISSNAITQPFANLVVSNALTTTNIFVKTANVTTLNVASLETTGNLSISGNVIPVTNGNTYVLGNLIVAGNVFSSLGTPLGAGGGYYLSLPNDIAIQTGYNGPIYGTTYPLSIGLSNGFTINGTSTFITITTNGNFKFSTAGPYILNAVFTSSDNITGLAVGSNVADIHGQDQNYLYRYTTFISQNPTEVIEIPINVTDTSLYYYLDLFKVDAGVLHQTTDPRGGTWLTIAPLTGGGLATGGPGGTPGTQWISSGPNIYFPNSVGVGAVNPAYNLDVSTGTTATKQLVVSNISSLGLYGPLLNISSNVIIQSNLAVGGGIVPNGSPPYALYVSGQGYFSEHVSYDNFAGYRNRLLNGTFRIAYRANTITVDNTSSFSLSNSWVMDRWYIDVGNLSTSNVSMTAKQAAPVGPSNGFSNCSNVYVARAMDGVTDNTWICPLVQTCEASGTYDLRLGQPTAKPMVLSFYANTTTVGTYSVVLRSKVDNTYFANLVTMTNSWNRYVVYVPACTIGTWGTGTNGSVEVCLLGVSWGTGRANVAPTTNWTSSPGYAPMAVTGATPWPQTAGTFIQVTGVQLELGTITTPFEIRLLSDTTRFCQRYYETNPDTQYCAALGSGRVSTVPFVVTKRGNPNVSVYTTLSNLTANTNISIFTSITGAGTYANTAINSYKPSEYGFTFNFTQPGGGYNTTINEADFVWQADSEIY